MFIYKLLAIYRYIYIYIRQHFWRSLLDFQRGGEGECYYFGQRVAYQFSTHQKNKTSATPIHPIKLTWEPKNECFDGVFWKGWFSGSIVSFRGFHFQFDDMRWLLRSIRTSQCWVHHWESAAMLMQHKGLRRQNLGLFRSFDAGGTVGPPN